MRAAHEKFRSGWVGVSVEESEQMTGIYRDIAQAYTNRDITAMRIAMLKLPPVNDHITWQIRPPIEAPLTIVFDKAFRLKTELSDFDSPAQFTKFAKEGKNELRDIAAKELEFWKAWIESSRGFTRQYANHEFGLNTDYAKIVKPERAMSRNDAARQSYGLAASALKPTGLSPAWLSGFRPDAPNAPRR